MGTSVRLFGSPAVIGDDGRHDLRPGKTSALLCYVAYEGGWVQREALLPLLWPEVDEGTARNNLRQMLYAIRSEPYARHLEIEPYRLRWLGDTDVDAFREAEGEADAEIVAAYVGPLLGGFHVSGAAEFMTWLEFEREDLHHRFRRSALRLAADETADPDVVLTALDEVLAADPFDEDVVRASLQVRHAAHGATDALRVFHRFASHLEDELGVEPDRSTLAIVSQIRSSESSAAPPPGPSSAPRIVSLPKPLTRFVGRSEELARLTTALVDPGTRLVTLRAPGGMGKTRLAIEAASRVAEEFEGPVVFVPLAEQRHRDDVLREVAFALGIAEPTADAPATAVAHALRGRPSLLVLDNLEQIASVGRPVAELLEASPGLTVLATSRTTMGVLGEHVLDLRGLFVPPEDASAVDGDGSAGDAADLFLNAASRVLSDEEIDQAELGDVVRVCRITGGMPLALELAANWTRVFSIEEVAEQLESGLDLLEHPESEPEARHASVRTVIAHSWTDLDATQRQAMMALSVLRGSFTRAEAFEIAGVGHRTLLELADRSFLDVLGAGRFGRHPMIDAFVRERAAEHDEVVAPARDRHVSYFADHLARLSEGVWRPGEDELLLQVSAMKENARAAWEYAVQAERWDLLGSMVPALNRYHDTREQQALFAGMVEDALRQTPPEAPIWARLIQLLVHHLRQVGRNEDAQRVAEAALPHLKRHGDPVRAIEIMRIIGLMRIERGEHDAARNILEEALNAPDVANHPRVHARIHGNLYLITDDLEEQSRLVERAVAIARLDDSPLTLGIMLRIASFHATYQGRFADALAAAEEALSVVSGIDDTSRLRHLGWLAYTRLNIGHLEAAEDAIEQTKAIAARVSRGWRHEAAAWIAFLDLLLDLSRGRNVAAAAYDELAEPEPHPMLWTVVTRSHLDAGRYEDARAAIARLRDDMEHEPATSRRAGMSAKADLLEAELRFLEGAQDRAARLAERSLLHAAHAGLAPLAAEGLLVAAQLLDAEDATPWPRLVACSPAATHLTRLRARRDGDRSEADGPTPTSPDDVERSRRALLDAAARAAGLLAGRDER